MTSLAAGRLLSDYEGTSHKSNEMPHPRLSPALLRLELLDHLDIQLNVNEVEPNPRINGSLPETISIDNLTPAIQGSDDLKCPSNLQVGRLGS